MFKNMPGAIQVVTSKDIPENGKNNSQYLPGSESELVTCYQINIMN